MLLRPIILSIGTIICSSGQPVSIGVKGGVPIADAFETFKGNSSAYSTKTKRYLVGPTIQFNFGSHFALEGDLLYKRLGYQYDQLLGEQTFDSTTVANSWEVPILAKFLILPGPVKPFLSAGGAFRHISGIGQLRNVVNAGLAPVSVRLNSATEFNRRNDIGAVFGGGVEFKIKRVRITPEFRYTRWGSESFRDRRHLFGRVESYASIGNW